MQYFGGKSRISKDLADFINNQLKPNQPFVDLFCGSCNIVSKVDPGRIRLANDKHKYAIAMWKALQAGWIPPEVVTEDDYNRIKQDATDAALHGFVGFGLSFAGKWWGGYCRSKSRQDYAGAARRGCLKKLSGLSGVVFTNLDYSEVEIPQESLVYCDIPYKDTTQYCKSLVGSFDHEQFWQWCKQKTSEGHNIFVSEYLQNVPESARVIWTKQSSKSIRNKAGEREPTTEVVYTFN